MGLVEDLKRLGLRDGDVVMVHASMRAVGGRAEEVVEALLAALGPAGTLLAYVDYEPTPEVPDFDLALSPAVADHGVLAETIRRWPGAVRSANPGASVVAVGPHAAWLCADHPLSYGYGPGSPFAKLVEVRGKVLLLGSHFDHVTLLHHAEHLARLPDKRVVRYTVRSGGVELAIEEFDTSQGVVAAMPDAYFDRVVRTFVAKGGCSVNRVGNARSVLLPAVELVAFAVEHMERDFLRVTY
jgi:aminoglycoside 3-N-acetyltransferase